VNRDRKEFKDKLTGVTHEIDNLNETAMELASAIEHECNNTRSKNEQNFEILDEI
jgi:hypothetical protein